MRSLLTVNCRRLNTAPTIFSRNEIAQGLKGPAPGRQIKRTFRPTKEQRDEMKEYADFLDEFRMQARCLSCSLAGIAPLRCRGHGMWCLKEH